MMRAGGRGSSHRVRCEHDENADCAPSSVSRSRRNYFSLIDPADPVDLIRQMIVSGQHGIGDQPDRKAARSIVHVDVAVRPVARERELDRRVPPLATRP
jgi:hypothetical protein